MAWKNILKSYKRIKWYDRITPPLIESLKKHMDRFSDELKPTPFGDMRSDREYMEYLLKGYEESVAEQKNDTFTTYRFGVADEYGVIRDYTRQYYPEIHKDIVADLKQAGISDDELAGYWDID